MKSYHFKRITTREQQVLELVAFEKTTKENASQFHICTETVNSHRRNIMSKLSVKNTAGMIRVGFELGWLKSSLAACILTFILTLPSFAQITEIEGDLQLVNTPHDSTANHILVRLSDGTIALRKVSSLPFHTDYQILSVIGDTIFLTNGGFALLPPDQIDDADHDPSNELQALSISNDTIFLSNGGFVRLPDDFDGSFNSLTGVPSGLADGDDDTQLSDAQIATLGYIKSPNDGDTSATNEIQDLSPYQTIIGTNTWDKDASDDFDGGFSSLIGVPSGLADGDDDTQLSDAQIATLGYIKSPNDGDTSATNEIQDLSPYQTISATSTWDKDVSDDFDGAFSSLTGVPSGLADGDDDTQLSDAQITALGYIKSPNDGDTSATNEIQDLSISNDTIYLEDGGFVNLPLDMVDDIDADSTNEIQVLSISSDTIFLEKGGFAVLPPNPDDDATNELQTLTVSSIGDTVYLSQGNFIIIPNASMA